ncbi:MAG: L,D-transpeptidase, partial [Phenylobacterium sp.]|nr:L,D-transpeptidase [Phenylobacterium sp.]
MTGAIHVRPRARRPMAALAIGLGLLSAGLGAAPTAAAPAPARADFRDKPASPEARSIADWVTAAADNHGMPFVIIDKVQARLFVFSPDGRLRGASAALLGLARGDDSVPGIGDRKLSTIRPEERTTPAGRFIASLGADLGVKDVLWVDYADAISLHRVITTKPKERRLQRLATPTPADNRISYGCINVPA